jgi:hypothetical protein
MIAPGQNIFGTSPVQSIIVDSTPTSQGQPSRISSLAAKRGWRESVFVDK